MQKVYITSEMAADRCQAMSSSYFSLSNISKGPGQRYRAHAYVTDVQQVLADTVHALRLRGTIETY